MGDDSFAHGRSAPAGAGLRERAGRPAAANSAAGGSKAPQWTQELAAQAVSLRAQGLSCGVIADRLGVTRNAVIGKLSRMNVSSPREPGGMGGAGTKIGPRKAVSSSRACRPSACAPAKDNSCAGDAARRAVALAPSAGAAPEKVSRKDAAAAFDAKRLKDDWALADLGAFSCRFPVSADDVAPHQHRFCGLAVADRDAGPEKLARRYCAHHADRAQSRTGRMGE